MSDKLQFVAVFVQTHLRGNDKLKFVGLKSKNAVSKKLARPSVQTESGRAFLLNRAMRVLLDLAYAVNEEPHPQLPVEFGLLKVKPEPITFWT